METEFLLANVQSKANPQKSEMFIVTTGDLCAFISDVPSDSVCVFSKIKFYDPRKQK